MSLTGDIAKRGEQCCHIGGAIGQAVAASAEGVATGRINEYAVVMPSVGAPEPFGAVGCDHFDASGQSESPGIEPGSLGRLGAALYGCHLAACSGEMEGVDAKSARQVGNNRGLADYR